MPNYFLKAYTVYKYTHSVKFATFHDFFWTDKSWDRWSSKTFI